MGEVIEAVPHPDADKLRVCRVLTADGEKQIVCGAPNARAGIKVVISKPGDWIPGIDTVIGVTAGNTDQVSDFSKLECRDKFAVAADPGAKVAAQYQTLMEMKGKTVSDRTSFVIAPDNTILLSYTDRNPDAHIEKTLAAVKQYDAAHPQTH